MDIVERLRSVFGVVVKADDCFEEDYSVARKAADEIERLREALQLIAAPLRGPDVTHYLVVAGYQDIARKALEGK